MNCLTPLVTLETAQAELAKAEKDLKVHQQLVTALRTVVDLLGVNSGKRGQNDVDAVKDAIHNLDPQQGEFTVDDVYGELEGGDTSMLWNHVLRPNISVVLSRLAKDGKLELKSPGTGRRPAVYFRPMNEL